MALCTAWPWLLSRVMFIFLCIIGIASVIITDIENDCSSGSTLDDCTLPFHTGIYFVMTVRTRAANLARSTPAIESRKQRGGV